MSDSKILKHLLHPTLAQAIELPRGSRPLSAALQAMPNGRAQIVMWTIGPTVAPMVTRRVLMAQTGHTISDQIMAACDHVATVACVVAGLDEHGAMKQKSIVEHVFLEREDQSAMLN